MARPKKSTVEYFPHDTTHGATMLVLETRWGNDGYAFWYKLLESLGNHENHYIDCRKPAEWELLTAKTRVNKETATDILDMLATMAAIDSNLWKNHKVIVSPNFLCRIEDAYRKRKDRFPTLNSIYSDLNILQEGFPAEETPLNEVSGGKSTEREREREREIKPHQQQACASDQVRTASTERRADLERLFPGIDLDVALEKLMNRCRGKPVLLDPYETVLKWLQSEFKPVRGDASGAGTTGRPRAVGAKTSGIIPPNGPDADWLAGSQFASPSC